MAAIQNHQAYCAAMAASLSQKIFWRYLIPDLAVLLDYGCADGALVKRLGQQEDAPLTKVVCFDTDEQMLAKCPAEFHIFPHHREDDAFAAFTLLQRTEAENLRRQPRPSGVLFSSVLHELYSQRSEAVMASFWAQLAAMHVDYIIIRDMYWGDQPNRPLGNLREFRDINYWIDDQLEVQVGEFEATLPKYESAVFAKHLTHLLLKYPFEANWQRELQEDYFSLPDLRPLLAELGYETLLFEHHQVEYIQDRIKADSGFDLPFRTHLKAIFKRTSR